MRMRTILRGFVLLGSVASAFAQAAPVTGILCAFSDELALLEQSVDNPETRQILGVRFLVGKLSGRSVVVASSGVGKVNAGVAAALLIEHFKPSEILYSGIAGALNPDLEPGDIVIAEKVFQHDLGTAGPDGIQLRGARNPVDGRRNPVFLDADPRLLKLAESAAKQVGSRKMPPGGNERAPRIIRGTVATGDVFVASTEKRNELRHKHGADAVEMEGGAVAQICYQQSVPCLIIRSISDRADANARSDAGANLAEAARNAARLVASIVEKLAE